jgi:hypothetical protein
MDVLLPYSKLSASNEITVCCDAAKLLLSGAAAALSCTKEAITAAAAFLHHLLVNLGRPGYKFNPFTLGCARWDWNYTDAAGAPATDEAVALAWRLADYVLLEAVPVDGLALSVASGGRGDHPSLWRLGQPWGDARRAATFTRVTARNGVDFTLAAAAAQRQVLSGGGGGGAGESSSAWLALSPHHAAMTRTIVCKLNAFIDACCLSLSDGCHNCNRRVWYPGELPRELVLPLVRGEGSVLDRHALFATSNVRADVRALLATFGHLACLQSFGRPARFRGVPITADDEDVRDALHFAARGGHRHVIEYLMVSASTARAEE